MTTDAGSPRFIKPPVAPPDDWWSTAPGTGTGGCCATCPIASGCALYNDAYVTCPVTGSTPPPAPPGIPAQTVADHTATGRVDWTNVAGRGVEAVASAAFGFGWLDIATGLVERFNREDSEGNPIDWGRLQLKRNGLCILVATLVPLGDHTAAQWVARALRDFTLADPVFLPAGAVLGAVLPVFAGQFAPGAIGGICRVAWGLVSFTARATWRFLASSLGWIVVRPAIWAGVCGLLIVSGRFLIRILTGA
ncbi:hypothetical protein ACFU51_28385 [Streptomyces sp. NPDC057430]|uniref:hypothetical protein n=1 Tax=Streptomyces sp. NPDC057430 TaxID=3346131 RepID=UPI0036C7B5B6